MSEVLGGQAKQNNINDDQESKNKDKIDEQKIKQNENLNQDKNVKRSLGNYILGKTIGEGTFGKVKMGKHILTGENVAIKILEKDRIIDVTDVERVSRELHILKLLRHPHIIQLYEIIETPKQIFLVMEFCQGGEVFDYIVANTRLKEVEASKFFQEIIAGIEYLHMLRIVHRDLKPENLLLDKNQNIKIVDFGLSNTYKKNELLKTACGSPCYAAPEMIAGKKYESIKVDIWSCGVILFALLCGYLPFEDQNTSQLYKKILGGEYQIPSFISADAKDLMQKILNTDPDTRINFEQIKSHPWFNLYSRLNKIPPGIIIGYNRIPVDENILGQLSKYGFSLDHAQKCIDANKHNHLTTSYYLLLRKHIEAGGDSQADINSTQFDINLLQPNQRPSKSPIQSLVGTEIIKQLNKENMEPFKQQLDKFVEEIDDDNEQQLKQNKFVVEENATDYQNKIDENPLIPKSTKQKPYFPIKQHRKSESIDVQNAYNNAQNQSFSHNNSRINHHKGLSQDLNHSYYASNNVNRKSFKGESPESFNILNESFNNTNSNSNQQAQIKFKQTPRKNSISKSKKSTEINTSSINYTSITNTNNNINSSNKEIKANPNKNDIDYYQQQLFEQFKNVKLQNKQKTKKKIISKNEKNNELSQNNNDISNNNIESKSSLNNLNNTQKEVQQQSQKQNKVQRKKTNSFYGIDQFVQKARNQTSCSVKRAHSKTQHHAQPSQLQNSKVVNKKVNSSLVVDNSGDLNVTYNQNLNQTYSNNKKQNNICNMSFEFGTMEIQNRKRSTSKQKQRNVLQNLLNYEKYNDNQQNKINNQLNKINVQPQKSHTNSNNNTTTHNNNTLKSNKTTTSNNNNNNQNNQNYYSNVNSNHYERRKMLV